MKLVVVQVDDRATGNLTRQVRPHGADFDMIVKDNVEGTLTSEHKFDNADMWQGLLEVALTSAASSRRTLSENPLTSYPSQQIEILKSLRCPRQHEGTAWVVFIEHGDGYGVNRQRPRSIGQLLDLKQEMGTKWTLGDVRSPKEDI